MADKQTYLGDGVYALFEHGMIWLRTERDSGMHEIALEPEVYSALVRYAASVWGPGAQPAPERIHAEGRINPDWIRD